MRRSGKAAFLTIAVLLHLAVPAAAATVAIEIKTVLASNQSDHIDPNLAELAGELKSVFRYSSYTLIGKNSMRVAVGQAQSAALPGGRQMIVKPLGISGDRLKMELVIIDGKSAVFQTVIELLNNASITVGGPRYKEGYLLFNVFSSF